MQSVCDHNWGTEAHENEENCLGDNNAGEENGHLKINREKQPRKKDQKKAIGG